MGSWAAYPEPTPIVTGSILPLGMGGHRRGGWDCHPDRESHVSGDRDHGLPQERWHPGEGGGHGEPASTPMTQLYDRRRDEMSLDEVERILI